MTHENNKSDYNKPFMDLLKYLPEPYKSDVNESLIGNLFNRFLSKQEVKKVSGYIGRGNRNATVSRQIQENDVHRQGFQLQPILNDKIGSVEHMASWEDIQNELERLGIDIEEYNTWGAVQKFNWVPPIDINKLINYRDYYWVDPADSTPQYITIRSRCATSTAKKNFWEDIIRQYGDTFPIVDILPASSNSTEEFNISLISQSLNIVDVIGDVTDSVSINDYIDIIQTVSNNGTYQITTAPTYDGTNNTTRLIVSGLTGNDETAGKVKTRRFNEIVFGANDTIINGDYTGLFNEGFILFLSVSGNIELDNTFVKVVNSTADLDNNTTIIEIDSSVTDNTFPNDAIGSLNEQLSIFLASYNCQCGIIAGWDDGILWDDNPENPLWGDSENAAGLPSPDGISDHQNLLDRITKQTPPTGTGQPTELWYDEPNTKLYQYSINTGWKLIWNRFDLLLEATTGTTLWDQLPTCDKSIRIPAADQWIDENKWQHKNDITNFASVIRATQPIIEYDWDLELNEWTTTNYRWSYRAEFDDVFEETTVKPPTIELEPINWWERVADPIAYPNGTTVVLDARYGDLTDYFVNNRRIYIGLLTNIGIYEIDYSEYKLDSTNQQYRTYLTFKTTPTDSTGDLDNSTPNTFNIYPFETVNGDIWQGYGIHWLFLGVDDAVPISHQVDNPYTPIDINTVWIPSTQSYEYRTSIYAQEYRVNVPGNVNFFGLVDTTDTTKDTRSLRRKSLFGYDDVRVYVSDVNSETVVRQFGNYDEIEEAVLTVLSIDYATNEFFVANDMAQFFSGGSPADKIVLTDNTTIGTQEYTVVSGIGNRIKVLESLVGVSATGKIHNKTLPLSSYYRPADTFTASQHVTLYTIGINFITPIPAGINVLVEVGPATMDGLGGSINKVRTIEDNEQYSINGDLPISQIGSRKVEQVKTRINQYPLFDIFTVTGESANKANPIFGYRTDPEYDINTSTGLRIVYDPVNNIYEFDQFLLEENDGELFAYRDYGSEREDFWYNPETRVLKFWEETEWSEKTQMGDFYRRAVISPIEPMPRERDINGLYWYNTTIDILYKRFIADPNSPINGIWSEIKTLDTVVTDKNLQTIWRAGLNSDLYIPEKVDWFRRSEAEYNTERNDFITTRTEELLLINSSLSEADAIEQATAEWYADEANHLSSDGTWIGDWETPDPLYYNHLHENRKFLTSRELLTHFKTIIAEQPVIPGYTGTADGMFTLLPLSDVNYSLGGTIKEFNDGFDTLLSSTFVNNVTPRSLIEFAHDQYETLLNSLKEIYRRNSISLLTNTEVDNILNLSEYVATETISQYEKNDQYAFIYGDTTTFTDVDGVNDLGVRNWIATLPYVNLVNKQYPTQLIDDNTGVNEVVHHDGHRNGYELTQATADIISQIVINSPDPRTTDSTMGESSTDLPPNNITEFQSGFNSSILSREGVYWYYIQPSSENVLYRYVVASSGTSTPSSSYADGTLWMDLTQDSEVLRIKNTDVAGLVSWNVANGLSQGDGRLHNGSDPSDVTTATISAWQVIDLNVLLNDTIFELEKRLYDNVPTSSELAYDFAVLPSLNPTKYDQYLEEAFLDYISQLNIATPYKNSEFELTDPFTWNYKRSVQGGGLTIISADGLTNSFLVAGDKVAAFDPCAASDPTFALCPSSVSFFIKNSSVNDGTWNTLTSSSTRATTFYNSINDTTRIFVEGDVLDSLQGIIYSGVLPSLKTISNPPSLGDTPNNLNNGSESGGEWRDLYTKIYNTPYPNNEPWKLQGYIGKPFWWDEEYLNTDEDQWGKRTWKHKNGFEIIGADNDSSDDIGQYGTISITGNFSRNYVSGEALPIDNSIDHAPGYNIGNHDVIKTVNTGDAGTASITLADESHNGLINYTVGMKFSIAEPSANPLINILLKEYTITNVNHLGLILTIAVAEEILSGDITATVSFINGAIFVPSTNTTEIKTVGLVNNDNATGRIVKVYGMWENIRVGIIPPGQLYPNGVVSITGKPYEDTLNGLSVPDLPTFNYFSVNIGNSTISTDGGVTNYPPDSVLPPYWDYVSIFTSLPSSIDVPIRSLYFDFSTEIVSPNSNYVFGDSGTVEWEWRSSSQFLYDQLTIAYRIDPTRYVSSTFGFDYTEIGELQIDRDTKNTPSHTRTSFHGDIVDDKQFISYGLNQWYVNFNRYNGYDANFSDFSELWTGWKAPLTYQFASFVDTPSLSIGHRFVDITNFDYNIKSKRAPGIDDFWLDALKISIVNIPYNIARYDNQIDWRFELRTNISISRNIKYYDVHNYQFYANLGTDECWLYSWKINELDSFNKTFNVDGDQTNVFTTGSQFSIIGSTGNDAVYDVSSSIYDLVSDTTTIQVNNNILSSSIDGILKADYRTIPWNTGDFVYLTTTETLPIPLLGDTVNGLTKFYIIKDSDTVFRLAETKLEAETGIAIDITTSGRGDQFVGEIISTFTATNSNTNWRTYALDKSNVLEYNTPYEVQGMQNLVSMINGYDIYMEDQGWVINSDKLQLDPDTSKIINWQVETERFISYAYSQRLIREQVSDRYPSTINPVTKIWTFDGENRSFITGDPVTVISSNTVYPVPLSRNIRYYMIRDTLETFRLAATKNDAENGIAIDITSVVGVGNLQISIPREFRTLIPEFEINPFRNSVWFQPPRGIVSNIITGPVDDIRSSQLIFNQKGNKINEDQLRVYRQDTETKISVVDATNNEVDLLSIVNPDYALLHLGGLHLFIDAYEHAMVLNNYTSDGNLLYDPFIGLNVTKYEMLFNRQPEFTHRPNVGGYYLETFFNQGASIKENFESGVENLRNAYDTYETLETNLMTEYSRKGLGYEGTTDYLTNLNLSRKSQFIFWRGQIQSKGSVNAVKAFINSRRFIDAKIDDFWAVKVGEFGSSAEKEFPEMFVTTVDARSNELRLEFIDNGIDEDDVNDVVEETFTPIKMSYQDRWYHQPDQTKILRDNGKIMYFDLKPKNKATFTIAGSPNNIITNNGKSYIRHNLDADSVEITQDVNGISKSLEEGTDFVIINNDIIEFIQGYGSPSPATSDITIWGLVVNNDAQSPARIIDRESETQISPIQFWDPARGIHYSNAIHNIDLQHIGETINEDDPAEYTNTLRNVDHVNYSGNWKETFVGTSWLNIRKLEYLPYYSDLMITDLTERFRKWGQLADWAEYEIFEWVESDVPPEEWDTIASQEEGDRTIVEHLRKSGIARRILLEKDGGSPNNWIPAVNKIEKQYVATDALLSGNDYIFTIPLTKFSASGSPLQYLVNVYINGKLFLTDVDIATGSYTISDLDVKESDVVHFIQLIPSTQEDIDVEVDAGRMLQDYEYSKVKYFDELGTEFFKYYFWAYDKRTKPLGKNRTMPIAEAEIQLNSIPSAHIFFQKVLPPSSVTTENELVARAEINVVEAGSPINQTFEYQLTPAPETTTLVEINGTDQPDDETVYTISGSPAAVTIIIPLVVGDIVKISYTGVYNIPIKLPYRFTQAIIRGLQGIVNADNRYTVRFTRNFTLRDNLDVENESVNPLDLKNLHEEWKIFRQEQQYNIDRWQWDRITESIVGYKLTDPSVRVPSYERELHDEKFNTDTQYGLDDGQAFVNGILAASSILAYLLDPDVDFNPIDINTFFINNSFDTPENIIKAMDEIYNTFIFTNINRMFFSVLKDAFTTKAKYPGILKTSMVSLHGIRPFQTNGVFDD